MRLDKYLKISRVIKRRTIAKDVIDLGFVRINGRNAKPSSEVNIDDEIVLTLGNRILTIRVTSLKSVSKKTDSDEMYEIIDDKTNETL